MATMKRNILAAAAALAIAGTAQQASAAGDWLLRFGYANVSPDASSSGVVPKNAVDVDSGSSLYVTGTYMVNDALGVELLAALPFNHDITLDGVGKIAETDHLPPTLSVTYHFGGGSNIRPYVGAGINYTTFMDEKAVAAINSIKLKDSWGAAFQAGVDIDLNDKWFANLSLRWIDIDTTARTNLGNIKVGIDPWVYSAGLGVRF
jgi:outer membrane protein